MNTLFSLINTLSCFLPCSQTCDILIEKQQSYITEAPKCESRPDGGPKKTMLLNNYFYVSKHKVQDLKNSSDKSQSLNQRLFLSFVSERWKPDF